MSIQSVYTNEQNEDGVGHKMTIGTSIEIPSSAISPTAESAKSDKCFALPYQDHDYGAPSISDFILVPEKDDTFDSFQTDKSISLSATNLPQSKSNGFVDIDSNSCQSAATDFSDLDITRCICGFEHDDGYMICCDKCSAWQHIDCMQIDRNAIPETYLCEQCEPRPVNQEYAIKLQTSKKEEFLAHDTDSGTEDEKLKDVTTYTAIQSTPTSMTITSNRHKRGGINHTFKKRKRSADSQLNHKKVVRDGKKRAQARFRSKSLMSSEEGTAWVQEMRKWQRNYTNKESNGYSDELRLAVNDYQFDPYKEDSILQKLTLQLAKVQQLKDALLALEDIATGQSVVEYNGSFMLTKSFEALGNDVETKPYPYVLFYNSLDRLNICVDSRSYGNIARFIRRSCTPNSEIQHCFDRGELRLFIVSKTNINKDSEVTIPFDFNYQECSYPVSCCCSNGKSCPVNISACKRYLINKNNKINFPSNFPVNGSHTNGYGSSDDLGDGEDYHNRKKSREERKMESYIRAFKELEKKEKRKVLLQQHNHEIKPATSVPALIRPIFTTHDTPVTTTTVTDTVAVVTAPVVSSIAVVSTLTTSAITTPTVAPAPAKCHTRRRSNRVRRVSKKLQTGFVDDEHCSKLISNDLLNKSLPVAPSLSPSYPVERTTTMAPVVWSTPVSSLSTSSLSTLHTVTYTQKPEKIENHDPKFENEKNSVIKNDNSWTLNEQSSTDNHENTQARIYKTGANNSTLSSTWQSQTTVVSCSDSTRTTISLKLVKSCSKPSKRPSSTVDWISTRSISPVLTTGRPRSASISIPKSTEPNIPVSSAAVSTHPPSSSTNTKALLPVLNCNVIPWHFQPGVPNGMVRINVCRFPRNRTMFPKSNIKKRWLRQIEEEEAKKLLKCDKCQIDGCDGSCNKRSAESSYDSLPIKKRKLLDSLDYNGTIFNENSIEIDEDIAILSSEDIQKELGTPPCADFHDNLQKLDIHNLIMETKSSSIEQQIDVPSVEDIMPEPLVNLHLQQDDDATSDVNTDSLDPIEYTGQQPSAVKRKVSLQEYLKRSKPKKEKPTLKTVSEKSNVSLVDTKPVDVTPAKSTPVAVPEPTNKNKPSQEPQKHRKEETVDLKESFENSDMPSNVELDEDGNDSKPSNQPNNVPEINTHKSDIQPKVEIVTKKDSTSPGENLNISSSTNEEQHPITEESVHPPSSIPVNSVVSSPVATTPRTPQQDSRSDNSMDGNHVVISPIRAPSQIRSRHNSSASSSSSKSPQVLQDQFTPKSSVKSTKGMPIPRSLGRRTNSGRPWQEPNSFRRKSPPRKVPSLTPAVPGQPIPSLMRTGDGRGPQRIFNRESPRRNVRSPSPDHWRHPNSSFLPEPPPREKYHQPPGSSPWRRHEFESGSYRRDSYGNYPSNPRPYFRQNSDQGSDNRPYSPKQFYRHENGPNYHRNSYNDHPPPFHKPHSNPPRSYSPKDYSPNTNVPPPHYESPYSYPHYS